jgi:hypothetical protein
MKNSVAVIPYRSIGEIEVKGIFTIGTCVYWKQRTGYEYGRRLGRHLCIYQIGVCEIILGGWLRKE